MAYETTFPEGTTGARILGLGDRVPFDGLAPGAEPRFAPGEDIGDPDGWADAPMGLEQRTPRRGSSFPTWALLAIAFVLAVQS